MKTTEAQPPSAGSPGLAWALLDDASRWTPWGTTPTIPADEDGARRPEAVRVLHREAAGR